MTRRRIRPSWVGAVVAATAMQLLVPLSASTLPGAQAATPPAAGSITLQVDSARSVNSGPGFVHKGDPVDKYKWLINVDGTGDPGTASSQGTEKCLPATARQRSDHDPEHGAQPVRRHRHASGPDGGADLPVGPDRSEERRVGKEC